MNKISIKRRDVNYLYQVFVGFNLPSNPDFSFFLVRNVKYLKDEFESFQETEKQYIKPDKNISEFISKEKTLVLKYSQKDNNGEYILNENGQNIFDEENFKIFTEEHEKLKKEYDKDIKRVQDNNDKIKKLLEEEVELNVCKIPFKSIPKSITDHNFNKLMIEYFCKENEEEIERVLLND